MENMNEHLLQSKIWEKYEKLEGKTTFRLTGDDFDCLVTKGVTPFGPYLYLPYGPTLKFPKNTKTSQKSASPTRTQAKKALKNALKALQTLAKDQNAYFIRIEPTYAFSAADIASCAKSANTDKSANETSAKITKTKKSHDLDPHYTWILDLKTASEEDLLKNMESRKVRYWRNAEKKGITLRTTKNPEEITILTDFLKNLGEKDKFIPQTEQHLKNQLESGDFATLYIAEYQDPADETAKKIPIAAALVYDFKDTRYYAHAATDFEHRKFQAGSIILIQLILDAKRDGKKIFDFWGITKSEDKNHPWYQFTQYKKSFGGREVEYSGTYDLILNPVKYRLYQLARKANRLIRKAR
ncbi:peptidoglycan bridge formation glycyltransferase FemA/FemB family protein [Candidatus Saccharibacteria bacterium]|nr:peptidoglycan bridge formation glycyltransferase FemA/FemB family protein [Candidatus Saccharibacteria bacterium]